MSEAAATAAAPGIWTREFVFVLGVIAAMFLNVALILPVAPLVVQRGSGSSGAAGLAGALFFATTVAVQLSTPRLLRRYDGRALIAVGMLLLGGPALFVALVEGWVGVMATMVVRGAGFGIVTVVAFALVADVAPAGRRAEALGLSGLAVGIPNVFAPSAGLWLLASAGRPAAFALAGAVAIAGAVAPFGLSPRSLHSEEGTLGAAVRERRLLLPFCALTVVLVPLGAILTIAPAALPEHGLGSAAVLLLSSGTLGFVARWLSGPLVDRVGPRTVVVPGFLLAVTGLGILAADRRAEALIPAGALFGAGLGALQTGLQAAIFERAGPNGHARASVVWNIGFDAGVGLGAVTLGVAASAWSFGVMFWTLPFVALAALGFALADRN